MINETRVRLMTRMSVYEAQEGEVDGRVSRFFLSDYLGSQLLHSFLTGSIAYVLILGTVALYDFETMMITVYSMEMVGFIKRIALYYVLFLLGYMAVTAVVYYFRYQRSKKNLNRYYQDLRKLLDTYPGSGRRR